MSIEAPAYQFELEKHGKLGFMLEKKNCNDEKWYFIPYFIRHFRIDSFFRVM